LVVEINRHKEEMNLEEEYSYPKEEVEVETTNLNLINVEN
jgi:hypothetical protein